VTHSSDAEPVAPEAPAPNEPAPLAATGPDPVIGAGITFLGIFLMGTGGASDTHYLFDVGVLVALVGAATFVLFVTLSALRMSRGTRPPEPQA
jgi:energy-converting hydrogenase Eha subunit A